MGDESRFWDRHAAGYARRPVADEASYQHKLSVTRRHLRPEMRLLEVGCGTGTTAIATPRMSRISGASISRPA